MMKRTNYIFALLLSVMLAGCEKSDIQHENSFERSYKAWLDFKTSSNNSYRYVTSRSLWVGSSWTTTITVENGVVVQRDFQYRALNHVAMPPQGWDENSIRIILDQIGMTAAEFAEQEGIEFADVLQWTESKEQLGTAQHASPASIVMTLDEIYNKARNEWLRKRSNARATFEAKNNGLISSVGYVPDGCMDDCFGGISIILIEAL